jgi:3-methyladenine DNA glycosylase/8-oxoguanine DNA glycosylase
MPAHLTLATLDLDAALASLGAADPDLGRIIRTVGPFALQHRPTVTPFRELLRAIVYQQLSGKAAATIFSRVLAIYGRGRYPTPGELLQTPVEQLRAAGVSRAKSLAMRDLAARTLDGTVPGVAAARQLDDEALIERLVAVRGVGRWTAEMLLIGGMGRPDVLPALDLGIQKGFQITYRTRRLPSPERILRHGRRWRPFRTIASWYMWRAVDM